MGVLPPHPPWVRRGVALTRARAMPWLTQCVAHAVCCQAAIVNTLSIRMAVLSFLFYHPWQPMRPVHGTAVRTLTSEARGCQLLHKHRCAVQTWNLHQKEKKKTKKRVENAKRERLETLNGAEQTTAPMDGAEGAPWTVRHRDGAYSKNMLCAKAVMTKITDAKCVVLRKGTPDAILLMRCCINSFRTIHGTVVWMQKSRGRESMTAARWTEQEVFISKTAIVCVERTRASYSRSEARMRDAAYRFCDTYEPHKWILANPLCDTQRIT